MVLYPPPVERKMVAELDDYLSRLNQIGLRACSINVNTIVNSVLESRLDDVVDAWPTQRTEASLAVAEPSRRKLIEQTTAAAEAHDVVIWTRVGGAYPFLSIAAISERLIGKLTATLVILYPGSLVGKTSFRLLNQKDGYQYRLEHISVIDL